MVRIANLLAGIPDKGRMVIAESNAKAKRRHHG
jgi:hypothetical protein